MLQNTYDIKCKCSSYTVPMVGVVPVCAPRVGVGVGLYVIVQQRVE